MSSENNNNGNNAGLEEQQQHHHHHSLPEHAPMINEDEVVKSQQKLRFGMLTSALAIALCIVLGILLNDKKKANGTSSFAASSSTAGSASWLPLPPSSQTITRIAFGSCMKEDMPQPFWDTLVKFQPEVTVLAGDQVYMAENDCTDDECTILKEGYEQLDAHPSFQGAKRVLPMVAIPDDHDYGQNDCHSGNPFKDVAKKHFFDFFDIPEDDERRAPDRETEGLYTSYEWGDYKSGKRLQLILLDTRYSRSEFKYDKELWGYVPDHKNLNKKMLSEEQWTWFEKVLQRPANVRLVVSTVQVLTNGVWGFENWGLIPQERERLNKMLQQYCMDDEQKSVPILLSGDRHIGALYYDPKYDLNEVTASSWTHTIPDGWDPDGIKCENRSECIEEDSTRVGDWVGVNHFGLVDVHWEKQKAIVKLIRSDTSEAYYMKEKWDKNSDAGEVMKKLVLDIP